MANRNKSGRSDWRKAAQDQDMWKSIPTAGKQTVISLRAVFPIRPPSPKTQKKTNPKGLVFFWWGRTDSNHRSDTQQIYSLSPLATRELPHMKLSVLESVWSR